MSGRRGAAVAALAVATMLVRLAPATAAASVTDVAWWSKAPTSQAPDGGLNVSIGPDGTPISVAAVRVASTTALESAVLILDEEGGVQTDSARLQVCVTPNEWRAGPAQPYADAPKPECDRGRAELTRNGAAGSWAGDVTALVAGIADEGSVSLMIVPAGQAAVPVAFEVRLEAPTLQARESPAAAATEPATAIGASPDEIDGASASTVDSGNSSSGLSTFVAPAATSPDTAASAAPQTADGVAEATPTPAEEADELAALPTQAATGVTTGGGDRTVQALFFVAIATIAGVAAGTGRRFLRRDV